MDNIIFASVVQLSQAIRAKVDGITYHPALSGFSVKQFDVMPEVTAITRGPVMEKAHA